MHRGAISATRFPHKSIVIVQVTIVLVSLLRSSGLWRRASRSSRGTRNSVISSRRGRLSLLAVVRGAQESINVRAFHMCLHPSVVRVSLDVLTDEPLKSWALPFVMIGCDVRRGLVGFGRRLVRIRQQIFEVFVLDALREVLVPRKTWAHRALEVRDEAELMVPIPKLTKVDLRENTRLLDFGHIETHSHAAG